MHNELLRVARLENGFEVEIYSKPTSSEDKDESISYEEPWKKYAFKDMDETMAFIVKSLPTSTKKSDQDEFQETFSAETK